MTSRDIQTLFAYNYWANHNILEAAARVTPEQFLAPTTHSLSTLRGELTHLLDFIGNKIVLMTNLQPFRGFR